MRLRLRHPRLIDRLWYRRLHLPVPALIGSTGPRSHRWVRLLPTTWARVHHAYADRNGYFWRPCPLCTTPFGGHQIGGHIPDPLEGPGTSMTICPRCTTIRNRPGGTR